MGGDSRFGKHLVFLMQSRRRRAKTDWWIVFNGEGQYLAQVVYRPGWRRYVLRTEEEYGMVDFDSKCLLEAVEFLDDETAKLKATWKKK